MIATERTSNAILGALKLARFDAGGLRLMEASPAGFAASFWAAVIIAPFFILFMALKWQGGFVEAELLRYTVVEASVYIMSWVLFPLVMVDVSKRLGWWENFYRYATARNWIVLVQNSIYLPIAIADVAGLARMEATGPLLQVVFIYMLVYSWFVARRALGVSSLAAGGVVAFDLGLAILINIPADMLLRN